MIHAIQGTVCAVLDQALVIECGHISYLVSMATTAHLSVGQKTQLHTYMHWNQEQGPTLFGFTNELERTVFLLIISCSGLGPKIALAILADLGASAFLHAVHAGDENALTNISGIGAKKAEQIIVHLKHKVAKLINSGIALEGSTESQQWVTLSQVLQSLNYSRPEIAAALKHLNESANTQAPFDQLMRQALSFLSKKA